MVYIDGVYQNKTSYTVSGTTLDFGNGNAPRASSKVECMTMNQLDINTPVDDTISTAKIQALAVTEAKIAVNAVTSLKIAENAITARELATNAIATLFIADNSVTSVKIAQNSILTKHIDDAQITTGHIIDANVTTAKIADNAVTAAKIGVDVLTDQVAGITSSATAGSACLTIDSNEHATFANNLTASGLAGINKAVNSSVGLSVGSDAASATSYGLEICNNASNTRFLVDGLGSQRFYGSDNSETARFTDGKLGIGTASPDVLLHLKSTSAHIAQKIETTVSTGNATLALLAHSVGDSVLYFGDNTDADVGSIFYDHSSNYMAFTVNTAERMRIDSSGFVGINTAGAASYTPLTVETASGSAYAQGGVNGVGLLLRNRSSTVGTSSGIKWTANSSYHDLGGIHMVLTGNSNTNETADLAFWTSNSGDSGNTEKMRIDSAGNVGIGTPGPTETLVVSGDTDITGQMYLGPNSGDRRPFAKPSNWGYSTGYKAVVLGSTSSSYSTSTSGAVTLSFNYDPSGNSNGSFLSLIHI